MRLLQVFLLQSSNFDQVKKNKVSKVDGMSDAIEVIKYTGDKGSLAAASQAAEVLPYKIMVVVK
jgi:hypothetical protein